MIWPPWLWIGTPMKFGLWLSNRITTWLGSFYLWRRFRSRRSLWFWLILVNVLSWGLLGAVFFWLSHRASAGTP